MAEVISKYREIHKRDLPQIYQVRNAGDTVHVNTDSFPVINTHRPRPGAYRFRHRPEFSEQMAAAKAELRQQKCGPYSILDDTGKPSWKRNWWERNGNTWKPFGVAAGIGVALMVLALLLAECGTGGAHAAGATSNPPTEVLWQSNWGPGAGPAPMPVRTLVCPPRLWSGSGQIRTLELRFPEMRCALTNIPVGAEWDSPEV